MELFQVVALLITLAALFAYLNHRFVGLPPTIGVMLIALGMSLGLHALAVVGFDVETPTRNLLESIDFGETLLEVMLAFLLFAGVSRRSRAK